MKRSQKYETTAVAMLLEIAASLSSWLDAPRNDRRSPFLDFVPRQARDPEQMKCVEGDPGFWIEFWNMESGIWNVE